MTFKFNVEEILKCILSGNWNDNPVKKFYNEEADLILKNLLEIRDEDKQLEKKRGKPDKSDLGKLASAFSNTKGGALLIGIEDETSEIKGIKGNLVRFVQNKILNVILNCTQPIPDIDIIYLYLSNNKQIPIILFPQIPKTSEPISFNGFYYKRILEACKKTPYNEIANEFKNSKLTNLLDFFMIFNIKEFEKLFDFFNIQKIIDVETLLNSNLLLDKNIKDIIEKQNIVIKGKKGTGKTTAILQLIHYYYRKQPNKAALILIPRERKEIKKLELINGVNYYLILDDIQRYYKFKVENHLFVTINNLNYAEQETDVNLRIICNYRIEDTTGLINEGFFTSFLYERSQIVQIRELRDSKEIRDLIDFYSKNLKLVYNNKEMIYGLLSKKIVKCPSIGYLASVMNYLKTEFVKNEAAINLKIIENIPSNLQEYWDHRYESLNNISKYILKSIRMQYEYKIPINEKITKLIFTKYFNRNSIDYQDRFSILQKIGWFKSYENNLRFWEVQIESIPLDLKGNSLSEVTNFIFIFIKENLVNSYTEIAVSWLNSLAESLQVKGRDDQKNWDFSKEIYQHALDVKENPRSYFGLGVYHNHNYEVSDIEDTESRIKYLEYSLNYNEESLKLNDKAHESWNNIGSNYLNLALQNPIEKRFVFYEKAIECFKKSLSLSKYFGVARSNLSFALYEMTNDEIRMGIISINQSEEGYQKVYDEAKEGLDLMPFLREISILEANRIEAHIRYILGRVEFARSRRKNDLHLAKSAENNFKEAISKDCTRDGIKFSLLRLYVFIDGNFDENLEVEIDQLFNDLINSKSVRSYLYEYEVLKYKFNKLRNDKSDKANNEIKKIEKSLSKLRSKIPKNRNKDLILDLWVNINGELFIRYYKKGDKDYWFYLQKAIKLFFRHFRKHSMVTNAQELDKIIWFFLLGKPDKKQCIKLKRLMLKYLEYKYEEDINKILAHTIVRINKYLLD